MAGAESNWSESLAGEGRQVDCVEIYLPKRIEYLSELYQLLREKVTHRVNTMILDGFSIYEADGVFQGEQLSEERTLVIRLLFVRQTGDGAPTLAARIADIGREIATRVAVKEEEIWICHYPQQLTIFRTTRGLPK